jgi:hypothetical protein
VRRETKVMRPADLAKLTEPYPQHVEPDGTDAMAALGLKLPHWAALQSDIFADFVEEPPYGIRWWAPDPGTSRRILISDQLNCCLTSVPHNMTEATLHWLEFLDASDRDSARFADAVKFEHGRPKISPPRPRSAFEQLAPEFIRIHQAGIVRALSSALDCLGGVVIAVAALPTSILRSDLATARKELRKIDGTSTGGARMQSHLADQLEAAIVDAGPPGWLDWTLDLRHMLVHRGRRIELGGYVPRDPTLYGPDAQPLLRVRRVSHLPCDPGRSDVEVFLDVPKSFVLEEEAEATFKGLWKSTVALLETAAADLLELWQWRRNNRIALRQPRAQWLHGPSIRSTGFKGYVPGSLRLGRDMGILNPVTARRLRAAALDDAARPQWSGFD